tara:strand:+ start:543 stop:794 length:252 start_codon:yes stop_codon:yes gene_type:complete
MTSKEFRMWLEGFLTTLELDNVNIRRDMDPTYNHLTMLKTINDKLKEVSDVDLSFGNTLLTEKFTPTVPPNPFEITCETKKEE